MSMKNRMKPVIIDYLVSNAYGCWDGGLKASRHEKLTKLWVEYEGGDVDLVRSSTRKLTDMLDEEIGFPLDRAPDYDTLWLLFYEKFTQYAREVTYE